MGGKIGSLLKKRSTHHRRAHKKWYSCPEGASNTRCAWSQDVRYPFSRTPCSSFRHRRYFSEFHQHSPWHNAPLPCPGHDLEQGVIKEYRPSNSWCRCTSPDPRFPVKAFAQMCLSETSSTLRLESHVVETLVLGSGMATSATNASSPSRSGCTDGVAALDRARRDGLSAICEFHGTDGWREVDNRGVVADGVDMPENSPPWQEVVWEWYDARF